MKIYAAICATPLGNLQIQCTDDAVQAILFTDVEKTGTDKHHLIDDCLLQLKEYFEGQRTSFSLPLKQAGTDFQQKIWNLLYTIPYGKTVSYKELSHLYGDIKAVRAIASANGSNAISIIIPCHRVIGASGSLTGYSGGLWRKQWLIQHEAKWHSGAQQLF